MGTVAVIDRPEDIARGLAADTPEACGACGQGRSGAARRNWSELCGWWSAPPQRERWRCHTSIEFRRRADGEASDAWFRVVVPGGSQALPVFLVLVQHSLVDRPKRFPHYQLHIPSRAELVRAARDAGLEREVGGLVDAAGGRVAHLRAVGRQAVSLHEPLGDEAVRTIHETLSALVLGLNRLEWRG